MVKAPFYQTEIKPRCILVLHWEEGKMTTMESSSKWITAASVTSACNYPNKNRFNVRGEQCFCLKTSFGMADQVIQPPQGCLTGILEVTLVLEFEVFLDLKFQDRNWREAQYH